MRKVFDFSTMLTIILVGWPGIQKLKFKDVWYSKAPKMLKFTFNALIQQQ